MLDHQEVHTEDNTPDTSNDKPSDESSKTAPGLPSSAGLPQPPPTPEGGAEAANKKSDWRENVKLGIEIVGLTALIVYTIFSILQWAQIRWTNRLTREALDGNTITTKQTLDKITWQIAISDELAKQALAQSQNTKVIAGQTHDLAIQAQRQAIASRKIATSNQGQLETMNAQLEISERPLIVINPLVVSGLAYNTFAGIITIHYVLSDIGRTPAEAVDMWQEAYVPNISYLTVSEERDRFCKTPPVGHIPLDQTVYPNRVIEQDITFAISNRQIDAALKTVADNPLKYLPVFIIDCITYHANFTNTLYAVSDAYRIEQDRDMIRAYENLPLGTVKLVPEFSVPTKHN